MLTLLRNLNSFHGLFCASPFLQTRRAIILAVVGHMQSVGCMLCTHAISDILCHMLNFTHKPLVF